MLVIQNRSYWVPTNNPETFQALEEDPSGGPIGIETLMVWVPARRSPKGIRFGFVTVPGHQFERLKSEDDNPVSKFPDAGLAKR